MFHFNSFSYHATFELLSRLRLEEGNYYPQKTPDFAVCGFTVEILSLE